MRFGVISLFPALVEDALAHGVIGRGFRDQRLVLDVVNPRDFTTDRHRSVDDRPFGGGPGMVMRPEPLFGAIAAMRERLPAAEVVCLSPQGQRFDQRMAEGFLDQGQIVLLCGRYEGIDERVIERAVDREVSLGDFVLSGGEFAALAMIDAIGRLVPGVLGDADSAGEDSFGEHGLLDCPHYTRPEVLDEERVPAVLLSGDHQAIARWRRQQALARTKRRRPELLEEAELDADDRAFLDSLSVAAPRTGNSSNE
ncbi:MAG: tRNA (guanosine(37)-N1)-methyltransferase TrmD [Gammaproteobacteria bacterium]|nr:MAG: tRNA (guanosine(37)-N1)-methyltransferase TrmD [Gammaproteobacteria bacterium]